MKLYFLRHAEAEDGPVDEERQLTGKGRRDARRLGRHLRGLEVSLDRVFSSPLVRAVQTAELVLKGYGRRRPKVEETPMLTNATSGAAFRRWLRGLTEGESILLVGHEPSLSAHVRALLGLQVTNALPLVKGAMARIDTDDRKQGTLRWLVGPKHTP